MSAGRGEEGFTLIELLVGIMLATVVMLATLQSFDLFTSSAARQTRIADASDQVRTLMERTVKDLRTAASIVTARSDDLIYKVATPTGDRTERICVTGGRLYRFSTTAPAAPATPAISCASGQQVSRLKSTTSSGFTYNGLASSSTPATVRNVGLTFSLDATTRGRAGSSTLQASATRRIGTMPPAEPSDLKTVCTSDGGALLKLDLAALGIVGASVSYANELGVAIGTATPQGVKILSGTTTVVATITDVTGRTSVLRQTVECA